MEGLHHHHTVARFEQRTEGHRHAFARPEHHRDLFLGVRPEAMEHFGVIGDRAPEFREPERERILVELIAGIADPGERLLQGEVERIAARASAGAGVQDFAQGHRLQARGPLLGAAEHRRHRTPHHVVHRRLVGEPLRQVHRAVRDREPGHPANDGFLDFHVPPPPLGPTGFEAPILTARSGRTPSSPVGRRRSCEPQPSRIGPDASCAFPARPRRRGGSRRGLPRSRGGPPRDASQRSRGSRCRGARRLGRFHRPRRAGFRGRGSRSRGRCRCGGPIRASRGSA